MPKSCIYTCFIQQILPLVMKEIGSSAHFCRISPREKEVACNYSGMHILRFYLMSKTAVVHSKIERNKTEIHDFKWQTMIYIRIEQVSHELVYSYYQQNLLNLTKKERFIYAGSQGEAYFHWSLEIFLSSFKYLWIDQSELIAVPLQFILSWLWWWPKYRG